MILAGVGVVVLVDVLLSLPVWSTGYLTVSCLQLAVLDIRDMGVL